MNKCDFITALTFAYSNVTSVLSIIVHGVFHMNRRKQSFEGMHPPPPKINVFSQPRSEVWTTLKWREG